MPSAISSRLLSKSARRTAAPSTHTSVAKPPARLTPLPSPLPDKKALCIELLSNGFVTSFVDFFYLTHKKDEITAQPGSSQSQSARVKDKDKDKEDKEVRERESAIPNANAASQQLEKIASHLREAEEGHRQGRAESIFHSYAQLAELFQRRQEYKAAIYFSEKRLDLATSMNAQQESLESLAMLGKLYDECGENSQAIVMYERCSSISATHTSSLIAAYYSHAERLLAQGRCSESLQLFEKCCLTAQGREDEETEMKAQFSLGICYSTLDQHEKSSEAHHSCLILAKKLENSAMISDASFALALNRETKDDLTSCLNYLELSVHHASRQAGMVTGTTTLTDGASPPLAKDLHRLLKCWNKMGEVNSSSGNHAEAASMFEKTYELAKRYADQSMMDVARINVGMARANVAMKPFMLMCQNPDVSSILAFKAQLVWPAAMQDTV